MLRLAIKSSALFSFAGGPLFVADLVEPAHGDAGFLVAIAPVGALFLAMQAVFEDAPSRGGRVFAWLGMVGVVVLAGMNAFAASRLLGGAAFAEPGVIWMGMIVGTITSVVYAARAPRVLFFRPAPPPEMRA